MADIEVFRARNTTGLAINGMRVTNTKPYGLIQTTQLFKCKDENIIEALGADVQPVDRWISVKDRVPEAGVHVLVTDGIHMMVTWCEYVDNQCLWVDNYYTYVNVRFKEVTHWMPLPEPPEMTE